jgi:hypothetical protein
MSIRARHPKLLLAAIAAGLALSLADAHAYEKLEKRKCKAVFAQLTGELDPDLVAIPYIRRHLQEIFAILNAPEAGHEVALAQAVVENDIRRAAYRLEALAKALRPVDDSAYDSLKAELKTVEKAVGDYVFEMDMLDAIRTAPELARAREAGLEKLFVGRVTATRDRMLATFRRQGWSGSIDAYARIFRTLEDSEPLRKPKKLKKLATKAMAKRLRRIEERIRDGLAVPPNPGGLVPENIEDGVHELRRQIRVVALVPSAFEGLFRVDEGFRVMEGAIPEQAAVKWLVPKEKHLVDSPILLPKDGFFELVGLIKRLGDIKMGDGLKEFIAKAIRDGELGPDADAVAREILSSSESKASFEQTGREARALFQHILDSGLLRKLADAIEESPAAPSAR